ncbi:unnamed protein product, partial [Closterium sp. NIES-53]
RGASGGSGRCPYVIRTGDRADQTCRKPHTQHRCFSRLDDAWHAEFGDEAERPRWVELLRSGVAIFDLDYDAILAAMYAFCVSAEGDCYMCVPHDPSLEAASLAASESEIPGTMPAEALHTFTLDSGASRYFFRDSTTLTPLSAPVLVKLADPSGGPILARSSTVLPCPAVPYGSLLGLQLSSFSTNLVSASSPALACPGLPSLRRGAAARHSSLLASPDDCSSTDSPHGRVGPSLLVVDDYTRYTTVFPLRSKAPHWLSHGGRSYLQYPCYCYPFSVAICGPVRCALAQPLAPCLLAGDLAYTALDGEGWRCDGVPVSSLLPALPLPLCPSPTPPLFLAPGPPPVDPLPPQSLAPSGVYQVDPLPGTLPVEVVVNSGASRGAACGGAACGGAEPWGVDPGGVECGGAESDGARSGGAERRDTTSSGGPAGALPRLSPRPKPLSL